MILSEDVTSSRLQSAVEHIQQDITIIYNCNYRLIIHIVLMIYWCIERTIESTRSGRYIEGSFDGNLG